MACVFGVLLVAASLGGCPDSGKKPIGATCAFDADCASGFCYDGQCLDPLGDEDGDGLLNGVERALGTNPIAADSDGDGVDDLTEVGDPNAPLDTDGDGLIDALESSSQDSDGDCIVDQLDPVDEDVSGAKAALVCNQVGVCAAALAALDARCTPATVPGAEPVWTCVYDAVPGYESGPDASCDGADNDCDGLTDEDFAGEATTCGEAACTGNGRTFCEGGVVKDSCVEAPAASDPTCDGVDDDCDAVTDEDWVDVPTTCGAGACAATGTLTCLDGRETDTCVASAPASNDATCNGVDDDCDGHTDEDFVAAATTCGRGACERAGTTSCAGGVVKDSCVPGTAAANDATCDGVDDDCDGATDEDYAPVATSCGTGACAGSGVTSCVRGEVADSCTSGSGQAQDADCDGADDDCDGSTDEDYAPVVTHCGAGACARTGMTSCTATGVHDSCVAGQAAANDATCNDVDDDCDGATDEDYPASETRCGTGRCAATGTLQCVNGTPTNSCTPGAPAANDASCNLVDDDCDGSTDEDYVPTTTSCGTGLCATTGQSSCVDGEVKSGCTPLAPSCGDAVCGSDGCGGTCGSCGAAPAACVTPICTAGACELMVNAGSCYIGGACYAVGKENPANPCQVCAAGTPKAWSARAAGAACTDDGESCTDDQCDGAGLCTHRARPDFTTCDDLDAETIADACLGGRCGGFVQTLEPVPGIYGGGFSEGSEGYGGFGANGLVTMTNADGGQSLAVTTYTTSQNGVTSDLGGITYDVHTAVTRDLVVKKNTLWELVDGAWTSAPDDGSLRAAWPFPAGAAPPPGFDRITRYTPFLSQTRYVYGVGMTTVGDPPSLVVRRCSLGSVCAGPCVWSCGVMSTYQVATDYAANITFFGGQPVIGSNYGDQWSPTELRILRPGLRESWQADTTLSLTASGRRLSDFRTVGGGALMGSPPEWIVGAGSGKLLYVTDLTAMHAIAVPGAPSSVAYEQITTFQGYVVVLARWVINDAVSYGLAYAKIDDQLSQSASWGFRALFPAIDRRAPMAIAGDSRGLTLLGRATVGQGLEQPAMWRFNAPEATSFRERFSGVALPSGWTVVNQGGTAPDWHVKDGVLVEDSNTFDAQGDASVIEKRGTFLIAPAAVRFGNGTLRVQVRATDDDGYGVMWGLQNDKNYLRVSFDRQRGFARVVKVVNDVFTTLAEDLQFTPPPQGLWHDIEVTRAGVQTTIRANGGTVLQFTDPSYPSGGIALYSWGMQSVYFDDVTISP